VRRLHDLLVVTQFEQGSTALSENRQVTHIKAAETKPSS